MPVVRLLFFILLLVNLVALALLQGWFGNNAPRGEPERLTNQLRPGQIVLGAPPVAAATVNPDAPSPVDGAAEVVAAIPAEPALPASNDETAAPATPAVPPPGSVEVAVPPACVRFAGLGAEQATDMMERVRRAAKGLKIDDMRVGSPNGWWVYVPSQGNRDSADSKVAELRALGVKDLFILQDTGPNQYAISLGVFKTESSARQLLATLQAQGVRSARVSPRNNETHRIEIRGPSDIVSSLASELGGRYPGVTRLGCSP